MALAVAMAHVAVLWSCSSQLHPASAGKGVERIELAFDEAMTPSSLPEPSPAPVAPPAEPPAPPSWRPAASAPQPGPAASQPPADGAASAALAQASGASAPAQGMPVLAEASAPAEVAMPPASRGLGTPEGAGQAALTAQESASSGAGEQAVEWPRSTRLRYKLIGQYRGEIHGQAQVEWIKRDDRYQTHIDVGLGPEFMPLLRRRMSSEGRIERTGLHPQRYEEETRQGFNTRKVLLELDEETVKSSHGTTWSRLPHTQDTVSQFVDLTHRFLTRPHELKVGGKVQFPLALPRSLAVWTYDVVGLETLNTPFGQVPAYHLKPRREDVPAGSLTIELWFAPSLQYLPVRIFIRQGEEAWLDLMVTELPQQARGG